MADQIVRALCMSGGIRVLVCDASQLAREICLLQQASPTASIALSRGLAGGALMGALLKNDQRTALKFEGNGPLRKMIIEADSDGAVRACAGNPAADLETVNGTWNVAGLIGRAGFLTVSKDLGIGGQPYQGVVQLALFLDLIDDPARVIIRMLREPGEDFHEPALERPFVLRNRVP